MSFKHPLPAAVAKILPEFANIAFIQKGGFKAVYSATAKTKKEALKLVFIPPVSYPKNDDEVLLQKEVKSRIRREIELLAKLRCPEIVKLGSLAPKYVQVDGQDFIAYSEEFLDGKTLWDILRAGGTKPTEDELRSLFTALINAIEELWGHKTIHRDIKPPNIIKLANPKRPFVLLDLGIAFVVGETALTNAGFPRTNRYMAPEMINPNFRDTLDYRSDLYTTALTVYEYGAQRHPIAGTPEDPMVTITRAITEIPSPLRDHRADLSADFCDTIDQLLKKKPALRPANLKALLAKAGSRS
jgi:serine/threonine protein kinase